MNSIKFNLLFTQADRSSIIVIWLNKIYIYSWKTLKNAHLSTININFSHFDFTLLQWYVKNLTHLNPRPRGCRSISFSFLSHHPILSIIFISFHSSQKQTYSQFNYKFCITFTTLQKINRILNCLLMMCNLYWLFGSLWFVGWWKWSRRKSSICMRVLYCWILLYSTFCKVECRTWATNKGFYSLDSICIVKSKQKCQTTQPFTLSVLTFVGTHSYNQGLLLFTKGLTNGN